MCDTLECLTFSPFSHLPLFHIQSVDPVSFEIDLLKQVPKYHLLQLDQSSPNRARRHLLQHSFHEDGNETPSSSSTALLSAGIDAYCTSSGSLRSLGDAGMMPMWIVQWRTLWKQTGRQPQPLPLPSGRSYVSQTLLELLSAGPYDYPIHRCNFAVMFLSELVVDMYNFEWSQFLPRILHVLTLGESCCICMHVDTGFMQFYTKACVEATVV